uniref:Uncharacterized protein n=1 Tax=candidate division WOR-3 bacterium TaxID=2052148 RepID=A0A7C3J710_UNCW3
MKKIFPIFFVVLCLFLLNFSLYRKNILLIILSIISITIFLFIFLLFLSKDMKVLKKIFNMTVMNLDIIFDIFLKNFYFFFLLIYDKNKEEDIVERKFELKSKNQFFNDFIKLIFSMDLSILKLYLTEEHLILKTKNIFNLNIYQLRYDRITKRL